MKAYHIEKAHDPIDLPPWLFEEHEHRPLGLSSTRGWHQEDAEYDGYESCEATTPPRSCGLCDVYDSVTASLPSCQETRESHHMQQTGSPINPPSGANDQLKALREVKRNTVAQQNMPASSACIDSTGYETSSHIEWGRRFGPDHGQGIWGRNRAPSLPASVRPSVGLPPWLAIQKY
jgi:hypothetical protein